MTLTDLYQAIREKNASTKEAVAVLRAQDWFCSLADFDRSSGEPLPSAMSLFLADAAGCGNSLDVPLNENSCVKDRLWRVCNHCAAAFSSILKEPNREPKRIHELVHIRSVRELDVQSFLKLSIRPGHNVRQKLAADPHVYAPQRNMSLDVAENQLLKACAELLVERLDEKASCLTLSDTEQELFGQIEVWLGSDEAKTISRWSNLPPNNTLLSHRDYRRVWNAWRELGDLDEAIDSDCRNLQSIRKGIAFWSSLAMLRHINGVRMAEIPLTFDWTLLEVVPFENTSIPISFSGRLQSQNKFNNLQTKTNIAFRSWLIRYKDPIPTIPRTTEKKTKTPSANNGSVCIDLTSAHPSFAVDEKAAYKLSHSLVWQRWLSSENYAEFIDVGCFYADGIWGGKNVETIVPLDVFFQDRKPSELLSTAFREMVAFLRTNCFATADLVWLVPDCLDDFSLTNVRGAINASFSNADPLPRSIAAVVAEIPYKKELQGTSVLVVDQVGGVVFATKLEAGYDEKLANVLKETCGIRWTRHPSVVIRNESVNRGVSKGLEIVNQTGAWSRDKGWKGKITDEDVLKARQEFDDFSSDVIRTDKLTVPLVCRGLRVHQLQDQLQRLAPGLAVWCDMLPELSISNVIDKTAGMYRDFVLVDPLAKSIRPVRGCAVPIEINKSFWLPEKSAAFPLRQGHGLSALKYVAIVDYPAQSSPTECRLDLRYTYGANEPYTLDFIPVETHKELSSPIRAKWKPARDVKGDSDSRTITPAYPRMLTWEELRRYPRKDGFGFSNLEEWVISSLSDVRFPMEKRFHSALFPMAVIMARGRLLDDPDFPESLATTIRNAIIAGERKVRRGRVTPAFMKSFHSFSSMLGSDAAESTIQMLQEEVLKAGKQNERIPPFIQARIAWAIGSAVEFWQQDILDQLLEHKTDSGDSLQKMDCLTILGRAIWKTPLLCSQVFPRQRRVLFAELKAVLETEVDRFEKGNKATAWTINRLLELAMGLLRSNNRFSISDTKNNLLESSALVETIDRIVQSYAKVSFTPDFWVNVDVSQKPDSLYNTPDFLYALRCYLTGDDGANAISITSIDEGSDSDDA